MSDTITQAIHITTTDDASPVIRKIVEQLKNLEKQIKRTVAGSSLNFDAGLGGLSKLGANQKVAPSTKAAASGMAELRKRFAFESRMTRQAKREQADTAKSAEMFDAAALGRIRERMGLFSRMNRQRLSEERAVAREQARTVAEQERDHAAALRKRISGDRYRLGLMQRYEREQDRDRAGNRSDLIRYGRDAGRSTRDAASRFVRGSAAVGAAGAAGTALAGRRILGAEADVDAAEIGARQYAGLSAQAARNLRDKWAAPLAEQLGISTAKLLTSFTDAVKLGIPTQGAKAFAGLATQTSEAWGVPFENVTDILGTVNTLLTSTGQAFSIDKLKSVANTLQHLAEKQSTTPEKLISFLQRGAGAAQVLGMSQEAGLAFGSASTSLGNQAGASGRMFDYVASRLVELPRLTRKHGDEGKQTRDLVRQLGYSSAEAMNAKRRENPDEFLPDFMERFSKIQNPKKQEEAIRFFSGREWMGEFGRMVKGADTYREATKLSKEAKGLDAIAAVWDLHKLKLSFVYKQFKSGWLNILGEFGKVLSPLARQAGDYFLGWSEKLRQGGVADRFKAAIDGFIRGLGFADLPSLLEGAFGKPGEGDAGAIRSWADAAKGFAQGLRDIGNAIASAFRVLTGSNGDPQAIGRWVGRILAFSAALVIASPVIGVLGSISSALVALALAGATAWRIIKAASIAGGVTGTAGAAAGAGAGAASGGILARVMGGLSKLFLPATVAATSSLGKGEQDSITKRLGAWAKDRETPKPTGPSSWVNPPAAKAITDSLDHHAKVLKQSFEGGSGYQGLIRKASLNDNDTREISASVDRLGARIQLAALGSGGSAVSALARSSASGAAGGSGSGLAGAAGGGYVGSMLGGTPGARSGSFGGGGIGGGSGSTSATGTLATNQKEAYAAAVAEGLSPKAARALVANMSGESLKNPRDHHWDRSHMSQGIVQWDPQRAEAIKSQFGRYPKDMSVAEQTRAAIWEIRNNKAYAPTNRALQGDDHQAMVGALVKNYERPQDTGRAIDERLRYYNGFNPDGGAGVGSAASGGDILGRMQSLQRSGAVLNEQCVSLAKAAVGATGSVTTWRRGEAADAGTLKPGTPIATFLDRMGQQSSRYAGGGTGTMGARLDHAGVFEKYITDETGKRIGMRIAEQYRGSGGVRAKDYMFGKGYGEANGSNYHAILGSDGAPLGGERNPMSANRSTPESLAKGVSETAVARLGDVTMGRVVGGGAAPGNSAAITAPINIYHHGDSEQMGHKVQRHLQESRNWRTSDQSFSGA